LALEDVLSHKYAVGDSVLFLSGAVGRFAPNGTYRVVRQLPSEDDDHLYRIKSETEAFERVAKESQLSSG